MANQEHLDILKQGVEVWNQWRKEYPIEEPDLSGATLSDALFSDSDLVRANLNRFNLQRVDLHLTDLSRANLCKANLIDADLQEANLYKADLSKANLHNSNLSRANLSDADLSNADLSDTRLWKATLSRANLSHASLKDAYLYKVHLNHANLDGAYCQGATFAQAYLNGATLRNANLSVTNFNGANLSRVDLSGSELVSSTFVNTNLTEANLTGCSIFGISAWGVQLLDAIQSNLVITSAGEPTITVDNLEIAQFIYLLLNNKKIRDVIDSITSKVVLILGRFTPERKVVLDALRDELRKWNYTPVLFDFEKPESRDFTETVRTLAHLARFIIADLTDPSSIPQELQAIIPELEVPVQPVLLEAKREYSMFVDFRKYHWVLPMYLYKDLTSLIASLNHEIIEPAEEKTRELAIEKAKRLERP